MGTAATKAEMLVALRYTVNAPKVVFQPVTTNALFTRFLSRRSPPHAMLESKTGTCSLLTRINVAIARVDGSATPKGGRIAFFSHAKSDNFFKFFALFLVLNRCRSPSCVSDFYKTRFLVE